MSSRRGHGEGTITKRGDGRWVGAVSVANGERKWFYGATRREVQEKVTRALQAKQDGMLVVGPGQTVEKYLRYWLEDIVRHSVRPRTSEAYDLNVRRVLPHVGKLRLNTLTPAHIQKMYTDLLDSGLSRRSVEQLHCVVHRALRQAVQLGLTGRNAADAVSVPRPKRHEMQTLRADQVQQLFASTNDDRLHGLWVLLVTTGLRIGEATGLLWEDVDLTTGRLTVQRAMQRQKGAGLVLVEPKTERSRRTVLLPQATIVALREHWHKQAVERLATGPAWEDHRLVFCAHSGAPLSASSAIKTFHRVLAKAGLPQVRIHDLRHTAATLLLGQGVHPKVVQELLGHSTITLTLDTYSHVTPTMQAQAATQMDAVLEAAVGVS